MMLHVYQNACEWFVAATPQDAVAVANEYFDECGVGLDDRDLNLEPVPDDRVIRIHCDENDDISDSGEIVDRVAADWAIRNGRGFLCSTEY